MDDLVALSPKKWIDIELVQKVEISHEMRLFKFKLQFKEHRFGLPAGYHMLTQARINDKLVMRACTPVSCDDDVGYFTLCVKDLFSGVHPKFPDGSKMSQYVESLALDDTLKVKGPRGHFEYKGHGHFFVKGKARFAKKICLLCCGTGLMPSYQVMVAVCKDLEDSLELHLLYANQTENDFLMLAELDQMAAERDNVHVWYTLDRQSDGWKFNQGFIDEDMLRTHIPAASEESFAVCADRRP